MRALLALLLMAATGWAATITNWNLDAGGLPLNSPLKITPLSFPQSNNIYIYNGPTRTIPQAGGKSSFTLVSGNYEVEQQGRKFTIAVPNDTNTYNLNSLWISNLVTYSYTNPFVFYSVLNAALTNNDTRAITFASTLNVADNVQIDGDTTLNGSLHLADGEQIYGTGLAIIQAGIGGSNEIQLDNKMAGYSNQVFYGQFDALGAVNVKKYGAVGDGTNDDTAAFQLAVNAAAAGYAQDYTKPKSGTIFIPQGRWAVNTPIYLTNGLCVRGAGRYATVIEYGGTGTCFRGVYDTNPGVDNSWEFEDFAICYQSNGESGAAIDLRISPLSGAVKFSARNLLIVAAYDGIAFDWSIGSIIQGCYLINCRRNGIREEGLSTSTTLIGNYVRGSVSDGIYAENLSYSSLIANACDANEGFGYNLRAVASVINSGAELNWLGAFYFRDSKNITATLAIDHRTNSPVVLTNCGEITFASGIAYLYDSGGQAFTAPVFLWTNNNPALRACVVDNFGAYRWINEETLVRYDTNLIYKLSSQVDPAVFVIRNANSFEVGGQIKPTVYQPGITNLLRLENTYVGGNTNHGSSISFIGASMFPQASIEAYNTPELSYGGVLKLCTQSNDVYQTKVDALLLDYSGAATFGNVVNANAFAAATNLLDYMVQWNVTRNTILVTNANFNIAGYVGLNPTNIQFSMFFITNSSTGGPITVTLPNGTITEDGSKTYYVTNGTQRQFLGYFFDGGTNVTSKTFY